MISPSSGVLVTALTGGETVLLDSLFDVPAGFYGYLKVVKRGITGSQGVIIIAGGRPVGALYSEFEVLTGRDAFIAMLEASKSRDSILKLYKVEMDELHALLEEVKKKGAEIDIDAILDDLGRGDLEVQGKPMKIEELLKAAEEAFSVVMKPGGEESVVDLEGLKEAEAAIEKEGGTLEERLKSTRDAAARVAEKEAEVRERGERYEREIEKRMEELRKKEEELEKREKELAEKIKDAEKLDGELEELKREKDALRTKEAKLNEMEKMFKRVLASTEERLRKKEEELLEREEELKKAISKKEELFREIQEMEQRLREHPESASDEHRE
ncbi:MAG: hypothetical protein DRJ64_04585, partial [Thermoprotei archaeon]